MAGVLSFSPSSSAIEDGALLADGAVSDVTTGESDDMGTAAVGDAALAASQPSGAIVSADAVASDLRGERDARGDDTDALVAYLLEQLRTDVTDAQGLYAFAEGVRQEMSRELSAEQGEEFKQFTTRFHHDVYLLIVPGAPLHPVLALDPVVQLNILQLLVGFVTGVHDSGLIDAESFLRFEAAMVLLTVAQPLYLVGFVAGTVYQVIMDVVGLVQLVVDVFGNFPEIIEFVEKLPQICEAVSIALHDSRSAETLERLGHYLGVMFGKVFEDRIPTFAGTAWDIGRELLGLAFFLGTLFGQLAIDVALSLTGVGFFEVATKWFGKSVELAADGVQWIIRLVRELLERVDPTLLRTIEGLGELVADAARAKLADIATDIAGLTGRSADEVQESFDNVRRILGDNEYDEMTTSIFCSLA